ncbi:phosphopantothenoylcysteine decarboxylase isoform X3 [Cuculus canorus]|uniref:phosphopantothenoylcysteine decarboxylase isoform X3 n=1 Tax=Cuculus canorus TaxID=55661 RepID=UPI0023AA9EA1|nr:phosphopantothenoylcysteine decarboxylase isoform X3 [Cuculus canorus]
MEPSSPPESVFPAEESSPVPQRKRHILVGVTGSVAALKLPLLINELLKIPGLWKGRSDPVLHIELRRWADLMLVAPLDANTLAKLANGICDNLLTCVIRAWDLSKPLLFCPAMNTAMWEHPITAQQVEQLKGFGYTEIPCVVKKLVCGDEGRGAMAEVWTIVESVKRILEEQDLPTHS